MINAIFDTLFLLVTTIGSFVCIAIALYIVRLFWAFISGEEV